MSSFGQAWAARRFRSLWMAIVIHGVEGLIVVVLVFAVVSGLWMP